MNTLQHEYDERLDVLTVEGVKYSGSLFRALSFGAAIGDWLQVVERKDGVITLRSKRASDGD